MWPSRPGTTDSPSQFFLTLTLIAVASSLRSNSCSFNEQLECGRSHRAQDPLSDALRSTDTIPFRRCVPADEHLISLPTFLVQSRHTSRVFGYNCRITQEQ